MLRPLLVRQDLHPLPPLRLGALPVTRAAPLLAVLGLVLASPFLFDALAPLLSH